MNKETEQNINEAIDWLQQTGSAIQDFAVEQTPLYCQEVVMLVFIRGLIATIVGTAILICFTILLRWLHRKHREAEYGDWEVGITLAYLGVAACLVPITSGAYQMTKAKIAPRVVILEHLQEKL